MAIRKRRTPARRKRGVVHHYFVPGEHNAHRPEFLEYQAIAINVAIVVALFLIALGVQSLVIRSPSPQVGAVIASVLVDLVNEDRATEGLGTLSVNETLREAAQLKADDMAAKGYFAHESPGGETPWDWFKKAGYAFRSAGENLAVYFSDSAEVEQAWMNSPKHRANILNEKYSEIGIAIAQGTYQGYDTTFVVQMFGRPSETAAAAIESSTPESEGPVAGASAEAQPLGAIKDGGQSIFWRFLTSPKTTLWYVYTAIAGLVLLALSLLFLSGLRRLHVPSLLRGFSLFAFIVLLAWASSYFSSPLLIL